MCFKIEDNMLNKLCLFAVVFITAFAASAQVNIIPQPAEVTMPEKTGSFTISKQTVIVSGTKAFTNSVNFLNTYLEQVYGFKLTTVLTSKGKAINLTIKKY